MTADRCRWVRQPDANDFIADEGFVLLGAVQESGTLLDRWSRDILGH
jgi:hypothetical protein